MEEYTWHTWLRERVQDERLVDRIEKEIVLDWYYTHELGHGTDGHLARTIITYLVELLDTLGPEPVQAMKMQQLELAYQESIKDS